MNYEKLKTFRFFDTLDSVLMKKRFSGRRRTSLYPSEASVVCTDPVTGKKHVEGGCHMKSWFRLMGIKESNPTAARNEYIFEFGKYLERMLTELAKQGYVWENNSVKFWDPTCMVSGEMDLILNHPQGGIIITEIKSSYGYYKEKELSGGYNGRGKDKVYVPGQPSTQNLLQLLTYLWVSKDNPDLIGGKLVYILRDNMTRVEFDVIIEPEGDKHRAVVNGVVDKRFFIEDIYERFNILGGYLKESLAQLKQGKTVDQLQRPPRDYEIVYTDEKIEEEYAAGRLSDTKYNAFQKNHNDRCGDWTCNYCNHRDLCWTKADIEAHLGFKAEPAKPKRRVKPVSQPAKKAA